MAAIKVSGCFYQSGRYLSQSYHACSCQYSHLARSSKRKEIAVKFFSNQAETRDNSKHSRNSYGPSVRLLLALYGIEATQVVSTGPHGRLLKGDVLNYINLNKLEPRPIQAISALPSTPAVEVDSVSYGVLPVVSENVAAGDGEEFTDQQLSSMRKTIAKRLTESKTTIPHIYAAADCVTTQLTQTRKQLAADGIKVSINDLIVKACAIALQRAPSVNSRLSNGEIESLPTIDIAVAVATDTGLITPIVSEANTRSVADISATIRDLAGRAKEGKLQPHEFLGGSLTVSNLGMFGIKEFKAVINPPQSCILAVGSTQISLGEGGSPQPTMNISLACDGRIIDELTAAAFVSSLKELLENPSSMAL